MAVFSMSVDEAKFVHFYWASSKTIIPSLDVTRSLRLWSRHLSKTDFIPILWCNDKIFKAISQSQPESIINRTIINGKWQSAFDYLKGLLDGSKYFIWKKQDEASFFL